MSVLSLQEAAEQSGKSKVDIWCAIQEGALSAKKTDDGGFSIDSADLFAVFETKQAHQRSMAENAAASVEASEWSETTATPETVATNDIAVAFAALGTELKGLPELPAEAPANNELRQNRDQRQPDLAERNAQPAELGSERAKAEKVIAEYAALAGEHAKPWWRRLVGWIQRRRGRAGRKRLRERL